MECPSLSSLASIYRYRAARFAMPSSSTIIIIITTHHSKVNLSAASHHETAGCV
jgi:hypothetical protein